MNRRYDKGRIFIMIRGHNCLERHNLKDFIGNEKLRNAKNNKITEWTEMNFEKQQSTERN